MQVTKRGQPRGRRLRGRSIALVVGILTLNLVGCGGGGGGGPTPPAVDHIDVTPTNPSIAVGSSVQLTATARDASGNVISLPAADFSWDSSPHGIVTVTAGNVVGVTAGPAVVTATEMGSGKSGSTLVTVAAPTGGETVGVQ